MRLQFAGRSEPGVGVAVELQLVDLETRFPVPAAPAVLDQLADEPCFQQGLFQSIVQIETDIFPTVDEVGAALRSRLERLRATCEGFGLGLMAAATHPVAGWRDLHITESPRYEAFIRRLQWVGRRAAVFGLRIHVGVPDGEKAIAIGNSVTSLVPMLIALSASSPFWRGFDTGLASCRTRVIDNIPNAGLPPTLLNFGEFQAYVNTLRAAETIDSMSDIWWDVRPNLKRGTLELQACDMPHTLQEVLAMAAFVQAIVVWLLKSYEEGEVMPFTESWITRENKWRAARFGIDAQLVGARDDHLISVQGYFERIVERLQDVITRLDLSARFRRLDRIFRTGPGYVRQRRVFQRFGLEQVPVLLMDELRRDEPLG